MIFIGYILYILFTDVNCNPVLTSLAMLKDSEKKPDVKDLLPLFQFPEKPKGSAKNIARLLYELGDSYDSRYTSILEPNNLKARDPSSVKIVKHVGYSMKSNPQINEELKNMKFVLRKSNGKRKEFGKRSTQKFQQWLWNLSKCPIRYKWIDMGENIFPRFIKRGSCSKKKSCSFPAGMKCEQSQWTNVTVLIYPCLKELNSVSSTACKWKPMILNVLTECSCGCKK